MRIISEEKLFKIQGFHSKALTGCSAVARGLTTPGTAVLLTATGITLTTVTTILVSGLSCPAQRTGGCLSADPNEILSLCPHIIE